MSTFPECVLLGDIGATNARFALATESVLEPVTTFEVNRFARFTDVVDLFLRDHRDRSRLRHALFAIAAPVDGERCVLTNSRWVIEAMELQAIFGLQTELLNDFAAPANSLPLLGPADLAKLGGGAGDKPSPMAVLGPGTGLGVACLIRRANKPVVLASESGHATLAATCDREDRIIQHLRQQFGHASAERALSGPGLENIYRAIGALDKVETTLQNATQITKSALRGECNIAIEALNAFCAFLGSFAGNVALTFDARGGVYIAGGFPRELWILCANRNFASALRLRAGFNSTSNLYPCM